LKEKKKGGHKIKFGEIFFTGPYKKAKLVIHVITPFITSEYSQEDCLKCIRDIIQKVLKLAEEAKIKTIALTPIGTGSGQLPIEVFIKAFAEDCFEFHY